MRIPKRGEKGFTLIELLIVVAILGVLAAIIVPNVIRFLGRGEEEAQNTEYNNIITAIAALMADNGLTTIPNPVAYTGAAGNAKNNMGAFPDSLSDNTDGPDAGTILDKITDPNGNAYDINGTPPDDKKGYLLYQHDITGSTPGSPTPTVNYVNFSTSSYWYTVESDGSVRQWKSADTSVAGNEILH